MSKPVIDSKAHHVHTMDDGPRLSFTTKINYWGSLMPTAEEAFFDDADWMPQLGACFKGIFASDLRKHVVPGGFFQKGQNAARTTDIGDAERGCNVHTMMIVSPDFWIPKQELQLALNTFTEFYVEARLVLIYDITDSDKLDVSLAELNTLISERANFTPTPASNRQLRRLVQAARCGRIDESTNEKLDVLSRVSNKS